MDEEAPKETAQAPASDPANGTVNTPWLGLAAGLVVSIVLTAATVGLIVQFVLSRPMDLMAQTKAIGTHVEQAVRNQQVPADNVTLQRALLQRTDKAHFYHTEMTVRVPRNVNLDGLIRIVERTLQPDGVYVVEADSDGAAQTLRLGLADFDVAEIIFDPVDRPRPRRMKETDPPAHLTPSSASAPAQPVKTTKQAWRPPAEDTQANLPDKEDAERQKVAQHTPVLAIIVDDGGYGGSSTNIILGLDPRLTLSILPYTPFGTRLAQAAVSHGFEIMLHLPMENTSSRMTYNGELDTGMSQEDIARLTRAALTEIPGAVGINNHTGSKFTANSAALKLFMEVMKETDLFFIDSKTTPDSMGYELARAAGIPAAERTLFLDNDNAPAAIRARFREVMQTAKTAGSAIAICHFRMNTAAVLREMLPELEANGIQLVHASTLVR